MTNTKEYIESITDPLIREFEWNGKIYYVISTECDETDTRKLMIAIINQAVKDFERLAWPGARKDKPSIENWETARDLFFRENYHFDYGDIPITLEDMLDYISFEGAFQLSTIRARIIEQAKIYWQNKNKQLGEDFWKQ